MGAWGDIKSGAGWAERNLTPFGHGELTDDEKRRQQLLQQQAASAGGFAGVGEQGFGQLGNDAATRMKYLQQVANGQHSVSGMQLQQGIQQLQAGQNSMAASASPQNGPMAARTAAIQSAHLGSGLAGQQAVAGLQERRDAEQSLAALTMGLRNQDMQAALGSRQNALTGYGAGQPFTTQPTFGQQLTGAAMGVAGLYAGKK